jgi:hypothetical protein
VVELKEIVLRVPCLVRAELDQKRLTIPRDELGCQFDHVHVYLRDNRMRYMVRVDRRGTQLFLSFHLRFCGRVYVALV